MSSMAPWQISRYKKLRFLAVVRHFAYVFEREKLIESLGDRMCGSGTGPSTEEIARFEYLGEKERLARKRLDEFLHEFMGEH